MTASALEEQFAWACRTVGLPTPQREYRFLASRRFRFDFAWPEQKVAVEIEGGTWVAGRHTRGAGFEADCEKYNEAALAGWLVLRFTGAAISKDAAACARLTGQALKLRAHSRKTI